MKKIAVAVLVGVIILGSLGYSLAGAMNTDTSETEMNETLITQNDTETTEIVEPDTMTEFTPPLVPVDLSLKLYKKGMEHHDIAIIQRILAQEGILDIEESSTYFGEMTEKALIQFQKQYNLEADGILGRDTMTILYELGYITDQKIVTRGVGSRRFGEYVTWNEVKPLITKGVTIFLIEDYETGKTFELMATYGGLHSDTEPVTKEDTAIMKEIWGGQWSWKSRPVLVHFNGRVIAASLNGMPHAGLEDQPEGIYVSNRSAGFGYGYNLDYVKGNDVSGHVCLHFKNSKLHVNKQEDWKHQRNTRIAAGLDS